MSERATMSGQDGDPVHDYLTGQRNAAQPALIEAFERESETAVEALRPELDIPYGPHRRQRFDFFAGPPGAPVFAYFHAGYWQMRDKSTFRFLAAPLVAEGFGVAMVNYPLCPEVDLAGLTEATRGFAAMFSDFLVARGAAPKWIAMGHSAGGHLAVELALSSGDVAAVIGLSGVYDLAPLIATPLNDKLRLDAASARAASPLFRLRAGLLPALFAVGGAETLAFQRQTRVIASAWSEAGAAAQTLVAEGADHFSLLRGFTTPGSPLREAVLACARAAEGAR